MITNHEIENCLTSLNLVYSLLDTNIWLVLLQNEAGQFQLTIESYEDWLVFSVIPLIQNPNLQTLARLALQLCRLNSDEVLTKYFIDADADIGVVIELPIKGVDEVVFKASIDILDRQLEDVYNELVQLSRNPQASSRYLETSNPQLG